MECEFALNLGHSTQSEEYQHRTDRQGPDALVNFAREACQSEHDEDRRRYEQGSLDLRRPHFETKSNTLQSSHPKFVIQIVVLVEFALVLWK